MDKVLGLLVGVLPAVLILVLVAWSVLWATGDANVRGKPGCLIGILVLLTWPIGIALWLIARPDRIDPRNPTPQSPRESD